MYPNNGVELTLQSLSSNEGDILHLTPMETQHPNNVVDLMLFQLYCHLASNPNGNATSRRLSARPDDLTQALVGKSSASSGETTDPTVDPMEVTRWKWR